LSVHCLPLCGFSSRVFSSFPLPRAGSRRSQNKRKEK
jgi:hypothetical protein